MTRQKRFNWKWLVLGALALGLLLGGARAYLWMRHTLGPAQAALDALASDSALTVTQTDNLVTFMPASAKPGTGFVFYPGAGVDFRSYAPALRQVAATGHAVFLPRMPFNIAFLGSGAAERIMAAHPEIATWAVGGHSLGGVVAADFAASHAGAVKGLVFWASYPRDGRLIGSGLQVLSISGALDGLATPGKIAASRANLPEDARFAVIAGGNHAQFGAYGLQHGDHPAAISAEDQAAQAAALTAEFLATLAP